MKWPLRNKTPSIPCWGQVGDFAFRRSHYYHPGIDLYCADLQIVQAVEGGIIVNIENFTGPNANPPSPWWLETFSIMVEGASGVIGYCELIPHDHLKIGQHVVEGENLAVITPVLKKDKGNGTTMAHMELYTSGTKEHSTWFLDNPKPKNLLNPRELLEQIIRFQYWERELAIS
jgi:hypothetical protein